MRHVILTCKHHPNLRWSTKECAVNADGSYNGLRNIFFNGEPSGRGMYHDGSGLDCTTFVEERNEAGQVTGGRIVDECNCPPSDLIRAPEDAMVRQ
jgi:hypothetical protein